MPEGEGVHRGRETLLYRALLLIGVAGVGKSAVADAIGGILTTAGLATAVVDTDALAQFGPRPDDGQTPGSSFYDRLKCSNLGAVWANYRAAGARFVVVSAGIDSAPLRQEYADSLAGCDVQLVRLVAATDTVRNVSTAGTARRSSPGTWERWPIRRPGSTPSRSRTSPSSTTAPPLLWRGKSSPVRVGSARLSEVSGAPSGTTFRRGPSGGHLSSVLAAGRSRT